MHTQIQFWLVRTCIAAALVAHAARVMVGPSVVRADDLSLADIVAGLEAAQNALPSLRLLGRTEEEHHLGFPKDKPARISVTRELVLERPQDPLGRLLCALEFVEPASQAHCSWRAVWDGRVLRQSEILTGNQGGVSLRGLVGAYPEHADKGPPKRELLWWYGRESVAELISKHGGRIVRWEGEDADRFAVIVTEASKIPEKFEFHVAPNKGFTVIYRAQLERWEMPSEGEWSVSHECTTSAHIEVQPGLWLPQEAVDTLWGVLYERRHVLWRLRHTLAWELSPRVPEDAFHLEFKPGTLVVDQVNGKEYKVAQVTDQMIADQVAAARRLAQEEGKKSTAPGGARMLFAACAALGVAGAFIVYRIKRRRKTA